MTAHWPDDHYDHCDTIKLECGEEFCPDHDGYNKPLPVYVTVDADPKHPSRLHTRGVCPECDSCWADVDANAAYDVEPVTCPDCEGHGEIGTHQNYWGQWDTRQCRTCDGEAEVTRARAAEWHSAERVF